ncbi:hypothetical protein WJX74_008116 [Apatococcus lobatus]|uniref:Uncharacterized protein n=1 Tax=Apatococcus lobatus TaxID=904363 RepID=A0AAW1SGC6_9CHLO
MAPRKYVACEQHAGKADRSCTACTARVHCDGRLRDGSDNHPPKALPATDFSDTKAICKSCVSKNQDIYRRTKLHKPEESAPQGSPQPGARSYCTLLRLAIESTLTSTLAGWSPLRWVEEGATRAGEERARELTRDFGTRSFLLEGEDPLEVVEWGLADRAAAGRAGHAREQTPARVWWRLHWFRLPLQVHGAQGQPRDPRIAPLRTRLMEMYANPPFDIAVQLDAWIAELRPGDFCAEIRSAGVELPLAAPPEGKVMDPLPDEDAGREARRILCAAVHAVGEHLSFPRPNLPPGVPPQPKRPRTLPALRPDLVHVSWAAVACTWLHPAYSLSCFLRDLRRTAGLCEDDTLRFVNRDPDQALAGMSLGFGSPPGI